MNGGTRCLQRHPTLEDVYQVSLSEESNCTLQGKEE